MLFRSLKFFYLLFLPLIWVATRWGLMGAAAASLAIQGGVIFAAQSTAYPALTVFELQTLLIALTITGLFLGITVDERQRADDELRHSLRLAAAGEMSAALAHELNQPLAALANYVQAARILAGPALPDRRLLETLDKVAVEAKRASDVVRRLRDFFRTGATDLRFGSLPDVTHEVVGSFRERAAGLGVALHERVEADVPEVLMDRVQIEVVLRNLVANGIDAAAGSSGAPRSVAIEIARRGEAFVQAIVRDSGGGIANSTRESVFEPFWSSKPTGMGMGLAISRAIVEAHGGALWAETQGHGAFCFTLPIADAAA